MENGKTVCLRLPEDLRAKLEEQAKVEGRSLSDVIRRALRAWRGKAQETNHGR